MAEFDSSTAALTFDPATAKPEGEAPTKEKSGGILPNLAAGFGEQVTAGLSLVDQLMNPSRRVADIINYRRPEGAPKLPVADQAFMHGLLGKIGMNPDDVEASSFPERLARFTGQGLLGIVGPMRAASTLGTVGRAAGNAATGVVASVAGGEAAHQLPDDTSAPVKAAISLVASLAAGIPFSWLTSKAGQLPGQIKTATTLARAGVSNDVAEQTAGKVLAENASDPQTVKDMLAAGVEQKVAGSEPTTFQATGDMGLGALERSTATKNPELFKAREAEQNTARIEALQGVQAGGNPAAVADFFRTQLHDLDTQTAANTEQRLEAARVAANRVGGDIHPETLGEDMRDAIAAAESRTRKTERGLWKAVDPESNLTGNTRTTSDQAKDISGKIRKTEKPMDGEELAVFNAARELPAVAPVADLIALRSRVSTAMREELTSNGATPVYARLTQLRGAIQDNLAKTISDVAEKEAPKVASGALAAEDTITARVAAWRQNLEAERDRFMQQQRQARTSAPRAAGLPGDAVPTFDAAAGERLAAATAATKERAATFGRGPVGEVLRKVGDANFYKVTDAGVPGKLFHARPSAFDDAQALAAAVGPDRAAAMLTDAAASSLRRAAMTEDGILDPRRVMLWQNKHQDALRALPQDVRDQFMNARTASEAAAEATAARTEAMRGYQSGQLRQLIGITTPEEVSNVVGQTFASPQSATLMRGLADAVRSNPEAALGLRQAVADHIAKRFISNTEVATSGQAGIKADAFQTFVKNNEPALRQVFKPAEIDVLKAVAEDIRQAKRSQNAVRLIGQSNTAQDVAAMGKQSSILGRIWSDAVAGGAGAAAWHVAGGPVGAVAAFFGTKAMQAMREAGIKNIDDLVTRAMLDPLLARRLLEKAPTGTMPPVQDAAFARAVRRSIGPSVATPTNVSRGTQ